MQEKNIRRVHSTAFKVAVALELIKSIDSVSQICFKYKIHPTQANNWKKKALEALKGGFEEARANRDKTNEELVEELYKQIGKLKVELDFLKKKTGFDVN
jgi:transposase-like protein